MRTAWDAFALLVWLPVTKLLVDAFGFPGGLVGFLLLPISWGVWVNLREHWSDDDDPQP
jgi:hypothetical protein